MCKCSYYVFFLHRKKHFNNVHKRSYPQKLDNKLTRVSNEIFVETKLLKTIQQLQQKRSRTEIVFERTLTKHKYCHCLFLYFFIIG